jgi:zinc D-Ala-D-Ala carboxypeptidase
MFKNRYTHVTALAIAATIALMAGCSSKPSVSSSSNPESTNSMQPSASSAATPAASSTATPNSSASTRPSTSTKPSASGTPANTGKPSSQPNAVSVVANPKEIAVLVNKSFRLPEGYKPDLVEPNVPFIFEGKSEKRLLRKEAADALEKLFAAAKADGVSLAGVSAYRSQATQVTLYNNYVKKDGVEAANKYSAKPGTSEHQTGLAIDVSGSTGKCAAEDCFAGTKEAKWLVDHAADHGFIIRYLKGKESITGYQYEPWHIRFVGKDIAKEIMDKGITLEEYLKQAIPVSK